MSADDDEIRAQALAAAQELYDRLAAQNEQYGLLATTAEIIVFAHDRLEPLARAELQQHRDEVAAVHADAIAARDAAWEKYAPAARSLAALEGRLAEAQSFTVTLPDLEDESSSLDEWRAAEASQVANQAAIREIQERIALIRPLMFPLERENAVARDAVGKAEAMLARADHALGSDDVFAHSAGRGTAIYQVFLLHSGLWRSDKDSPIGMQWLRDTGKGEEIEARIERGVRRDVAAHGPEIRAARPAHPLWGTSSAPGGNPPGSPGGDPWSATPGVPGLGEGIEP